MVLFFLAKEGLFEQTIDFAQYPEDRNKKKRDYEQQELDGHSIKPFTRLIPNAEELHTFVR